MKIVVVIPTYKEKKNIKQLIQTLEEEVFPAIKNHTMAIHIADDNSPDGTATMIKQLAKKWKNITISQAEKKGLGAAYLRGLTYAVEKMDADSLLQMDADLSHNPHKIPEFLKKLDQGYDMVIGTRYSDGGSIPQNWPWYRKLFSIVANFTIRVILTYFKIHDWTGGFRLYKKDVFLRAKSELTEFVGYTYNVSFLYKTICNGFTVAEVPFDFVDRNIGKSKIATGDYITNLLKYLFTARYLEFVHFFREKTYILNTGIVKKVNL